MVLNNHLWTIKKWKKIAQIGWYKITICKQVKNITNQIKQRKKKNNYKTITKQLQNKKKKNKL